MKPLFTHSDLRKMGISARRGKWSWLVELDKIPAFASWLTCRHGFIQQSPDTGEVLVAYKHGERLEVTYDGKRTRCGRHLMALWYTFACFCLCRSS